MWGGGANTRWRAPSYSIAQSLPKNCMKMKEFGPEECVPSILPWILHCIWVSHERVNFIHSSELHRSINKSLNVSTKMFVQECSKHDPNTVHEEHALLISSKEQKSVLLIHRAKGHLGYFIIGKKHHRFNIMNPY